MAEKDDDFEAGGEAAGLDPETPKKRTGRVIHGVPRKTRKAIPPAGALSEGAEISERATVDHPFTEEAELARLAARAKAIGLPDDPDDIDDAITEKLRDGYSLPGFVHRYREALKATDRRRRRRPRFAPESPREAARLIGRLMGHIEAAMEDYLSDTYELSPREARPGHIVAGARMAHAAADLGETVASLAGEARRFHFAYQKLAQSPGPQGEGE